MEVDNAKLNEFMGKAVGDLGAAMSAAGLTRVGATMTEIMEVMGAKSVDAAIAKARASASGRPIERAANGSK